MALPMEKERYLFAQFLCMNDQQRAETFGYRHQYEFAEEHGLTPKTLSTWKADLKFKKMKEKMQWEMWDDKLANVVEATYQRAVRDGDVSAQTQFYKLVGVTKDKVETTSSQDIEYILTGIVGILKEEIDDATLLNRISEQILALAKEL